MFLTWVLEECWAEQQVNTHLINFHNYNLAMFFLIIMLQHISYNVVRKYKVMSTLAHIKLCLFACE